MLYEALVRYNCGSGTDLLGNNDLLGTIEAFIHASAEAMKQVFGKDTVYIRSGGSIPIVGVFDRYLGIPSVMMGFGLPDDNIHAPNEKFLIANYARGIDAMVEYFSSF